VVAYCLHAGLWHISETNSFMCQIPNRFIHRTTQILYESWVS
jgi:hypothetical protein